MKRLALMLTVWALVGGACISAAQADEEGRKGKVIEGKFVRLVEKQISEREYLGVVVSPGEGKDAVTLLVPLRKTEEGRWVRLEELAGRARRLRPGQHVEVLYAVEEGQKWIRKIGGAPPREGTDESEGERPRGELAELARTVRRLQERLAKLERQVAELREANAALRRKVGETARPDRDRGEAQERREREGGEGRDRDRREGDQPRVRDGTVTGAFVKLVERNIGEAEHVCLLLRVPDKDEPVLLVIPNRRREGRIVRDPELMAAARKLKPGEKVKVAWVAERGDEQLWVRRIVR